LSLTKFSYHHHNNIHSILINSICDQFFIHRFLVAEGHTIQRFNWENWFWNMCISLLKIHCFHTTIQKYCNIASISIITLSLMKNSVESWFLICTHYKAFKKGWCQLSKEPNGGKTISLVHYKAFQYFHSYTNTIQL